jgi:tetratricopeptide (TPR) repeat protein
VCLIAALVAGVPVAAQQPPSEFMRLLGLYRTGDAAAAVRAVAGWSEARVRAEVKLPRDAEDTDTLLAAASLLTEAGITAGTFGRLAANTSGEVMLGSYGIEKPFEPFSYHAYRWLEEVAKRAKREKNREQIAAVRNWYKVAVTFCELTEEHCAEGLLQRAGYLFGNDDVEYLLLAGAMGHGSRLTKARANELGWLERQKRAWIMMDLFEKALAVDPTLLEARLRMAHIMSVYLNDPKAQPMLEAVLADAQARSNAHFAYLAAFILGEYHEYNDRLDEAARWYRVAVDVMRGRVASIALGQALIRLGRRDEGFAAGRLMFEGEGRGGDPLPDPWEQYHIGMEGRMDEWLGQLRERARR